MIPLCKRCSCPEFHETAEDCLKTVQELHVATGLEVVELRLRVRRLEAALFRVMSWDTNASTCSDCTKRTRSRFDDPAHESDCAHLRDRNAAYKLLGRLDCVATGYDATDQSSTGTEE